MDKRKKSIIIERFFANKTRRKRIAQLAAVLSVLVVAGVFWRLTQPVITMTANPVCGKTEHTHSSACYQDVLTCGQEEGEEHSHTSSCYSSVLCCGKSEHVHTSACYPETVEEPTTVASADATTDETQNEVSGGASSQEPAAAETAEAPASETTDAPVGETTDAPAGETTDAPAGETTDAPAGEPTDAPTGEPTEAPTEEPTAVPAPVLERLSASAERVYVGQSVTWSFAAAHADALTYKIVDATGAAVASGALAADVQSVSWTASAIGSYTMTVTATNESGSDSASASVTVEEAEELTASVWMDARSCFAGDSVTVYMATSGGAELTNVELTVAQDGNVLASQQSISDSIRVTTSKATGVGTLTAKLTVTDALGTTVTDSCEIPVAVKTTGDKDKWMQAARIELGESWPENLLAVAETQLGYKESSENFIIREDGSRQGYSIYGDWYGCPYEEWCAMFVSFCLDRADVPEYAFSRDASCAQWISELRYMGLYANRSACEPAPGDLIFFDWDGDQHSDHVGIVSDVRASTVETIEGNSGRSVRRRSYALDDSQIMGYGLLNLAYENYLAENADTAADDAAADDTAAADEPIPVDEMLSQAQDDQTAIGFEAFMAEIEALEEGDEAALTDLEDRIIEAYDAGALSDEELAALAAALYGDIATYSDETAQEMITISLVINNSEYTYDTGSGCSHVQIESTDVEGLNTTDFTYTALGTGKAYWVGGTGTLISYTIPAGTSMSDNGLSFLKLTISNLVNNGTDNNTNRYVSPYSWVNSENKVCSVNTVFNADTALYLSLYSESEVYYFDYCCSPDGNHSISQALSSLYPSATITIGQSVTSDYIPLAAHVNANFSDESCGFGLAQGMVFDHWYLLKSDGTEVAFTEGLQITGDYVSAEYGNAIKVYAKWEAITADSMVTVSFKMPDGSTAPAAVAINTGASLGDLMPENPTMYNCEFLGWSYDGGQTWVDSTTPITSDVTLTAVFNATVTVYTRDYASGNTSSESTKGTYTVKTGHSLAEAVNSAGEHIAADSFIGSYMFMGWQPETDSTYTKDLSGCIVNWAMGVSEVYERVYTLSFQYTLDGVTQQAKSYYVKGGGTYYDALDMDGNALENPDEVFAAIQVPGYQFNGWLDENGSSYYPSRYNNFWQDRTFTADLTKLNVVSFRQADVADVDGDGDTEEYITIDTRYVAANQALRTAVDANGAALAALPNAQATEEAVFSRWVATVDGEAVEVTLETVITGDLVCTAEFSTDFVTVNYVYADAESGVQTEVYPSAQLLSGAEIAEADMPVQEDLTENSYPTDYYLSGWKVMNESGELVDVELPYVVRADTTFYAQFEAPLTITFKYVDGQEDYLAKVRAGTTFEALNENPEIPAPEGIIGTEADGIGRFMGWTYAVLENGATDYTYVLAEGDLVLTSNMTFIAGYDFTTYSIIVRDMDPDGNDYAAEGNADFEFNIELLAYPGQTLRQVFADSYYQTHDGSDGADRIWYTLDESGNKTLIDVNAAVTADMEIYTYTYRITMIRTTTDASTDEAASTSLLDYVLPSAEAAAYVWINDEGTQITIELAEGDKLKLSDFVIDGVDYSVYSWTFVDGTGNAISGITSVADLINYVNNEGLTENLTGSMGDVISSLANPETFTINFYVFINGERELVEGKAVSVDAYLKDGRYYISSAQLEAVYGKYGFAAGDWDANRRLFWHSKVDEGTIWGDINAIEFPDTGLYFVPVLRLDNNATTCNVYYLPNATDSPTSGSYTNFASANTFYTVTVIDSEHQIYGEGEEIPEVQYVLTGETATVTVKAPEDTESGMGWIILGASSNEKTENDDGTISYTFNSVTAPITIRPGIPGEVQIDYVVKGEFEQVGTKYSPTLQQWHEAAPDVAELTASDGSNDTSKTFSESLVVSDAGYVVKAPTRETWVSRADYGTKGDILFTYRFEGWKLLKSDGTAITDSDGNALVLQPGVTISKQDMEQYASDANGLLKLESVWSTGGESTSSTVTNAADTVAFYVRVDSTVADTEGSDNATTAGYYSDAVYTTYVVGGDAKLTNVNNSVNIIVGSDSTNAVEIDARIRSLYPNGVDGVSIGGFPSDEEVLARLRTWSARAQAGYNTSIQLDGDNVPVEDLTTENFMIRWFVFKYDKTDAWHIDGLLVPRVGKLTIQKSFYGYSAAVADVKENYSITVEPTDSTSNATAFTLRLEQSPTVGTGYTSYDSETDTYTWVLDTYQNTQYKVTENNYTAKDTYNGVSIASLAEYVIRNSGGSNDGKWLPYTTDGVVVTPRSYPVDIGEPESYQTVSFLNSYIPTNTMVVRKVDASSGRGIGNVSFQLYKKVNGEFTEQAVYQDSNGVYYIYQDSSSSYTPVDRLTGNNQGIFTLIGLKDAAYAGTYRLVEVAAPDGYNQILDPIEFTADASGTITLTPHDNATLTADGITLRITNESKTTQLVVRKEWAEGETKLPVTLQLYKNGASMGSAYSATLDGTVEEGEKETSAWTVVTSDVPLFENGIAANYSVRETWIGDTAYESSADTDGYSNYVVTYDPILYTYADQSTSGSATRTVTDTDGNEITEYAEIATLVVHNSTDSGSISFTKVDENGNPLSGAEFALYTLYAANNTTMGTASSGEDGKVEFSDVPFGVYYLMQETNAPTGYLLDSTRYKVFLSANGVQVYAPQLDADGNVLKDDEGNIIYGEGQTLTQLSNQPIPVDIVVKKVDNSDSTVLLSGATFQLKKKGAGDVYENVGDPKTTGEDGAISFTGLLPGEYQLIETVAPAGYYLKTEPIVFTIVPGAVSGADDTIFAITDEGNVFTVPNQSGSELPQTGGSGTIPYTIGGLLIMAVALLCGYGSRRRHGRGVGRE